MYFLSLSSDCSFLAMQWKCQSFSCVWLFVTPWTVAHQAPLSVEFSRQEYWSGLPFPSPGDLYDPGTEHGSPTLQADSLLTELPGNPLLCRRTITTLSLKKKIRESSFLRSPECETLKTEPLQISSIIRTETFIEDQLSLTPALYDINIWLIES